MQSLTLPCQTESNATTVVVYIGHPDDGAHPLRYQAKWLAETYGGSLPKSVMNDLEELGKTARNLGCSPETLWCRCRKEGH